MGWEDIKDVPSLNLREELHALLAKEAEYARPRPDLAHGRDAIGHRGSAPPSSREEDRIAALRQQVCQWNYEWVDHFLVEREVVHLSMNYFDRYLDARRDERGGCKQRKTPLLSEELAQLLALTSLYVACKRQGAAAATDSSSRSRAVAMFRLQDFCDLSGGAYGPRMIEGMEQLLLAGLRWRLHPPTPTDFLCRFAKLLSLSLQDSSNDDRDRRCGQEASRTDGGGWAVFELARYQIELAAYCPELCHTCPPSAVALAALLNAATSNIVGTVGTALPSHVHRSFLHRLRCLEEGFGEENMAVSVQQASMALKTLCPDTIVLPGQEEAQSSLEYELPKDQVLVDVSISPVGVDSDRL